MLKYINNFFYQFTYSFYKHLLTLLSKHIKVIKIIMKKVCELDNRFSVKKCHDWNKLTNTFWMSDRTSLTRSFSSLPETIASSEYFCRWLNKRAGCPILTTRCFKAANLSTRLSTAILEGAAARTCYKTNPKFMFRFIKLY